MQVGGRTGAANGVCLSSEGQRFQANGFKKRNLIIVLVLKASRLSAQGSAWRRYKSHAPQTLCSQGTGMVPGSSRELVRQRRLRSSSHEGARPRVLMCSASERASLRWLAPPASVCRSAAFNNIHIYIYV